MTQYSIDLIFDYNLRSADCICAYLLIFKLFNVLLTGEGEEVVDMVRVALHDRQAAINRQKEEAKKRRRKKKRTGSSLFASTFNGTF